MKPVKKLTLSAIVVALYIAAMFLTQGFAFGQYQIRIATALYSLTYYFPFLILPLGLSNFLSNTFMGGLGPLDMIGGTLVGIITSGAIYLIRKLKWSQWLVALPIILGPGLLVPTWLSYLIHVPYKVLALSLCIGQITPAIVGVLLVKYADRFLGKDRTLVNN